MADDLLSPKEVAPMLKVTTQALASWRWMGTGPDYIKTSPGRSGRIRYRRSSVEKWLNERTVSGGQAA